MYEIKNLKDLEIAMTELEAQRDKQWLELKTQLADTIEELRPGNLLKNAVQEIITSPDIQNSLVDSAIGVGTGFLAKKLVFGQTRNPISRILGTILETAVSNRVSKHPDGIKSMGKFLIDKFFSSKNGHADHHHNGHSETGHAQHEDRDTMND